MDFASNSAYRVTLGPGSLSCAGVTGTPSAVFPSGGYIFLFP